MRRFIVVLAALCLVVTLPMSSFGAQPAGTTKLSAAGAVFMTEDGGYCYRMTITFLYDRFRAVQPEDPDQTPPSYHPQLTISVDQYTSCDESGEWLEEVQPTQSADFAEGDSYLMNDLASAYVDFNDWNGFADRPELHYHIWLAWVADGTPVQVVDTHDPSKSVRQEVSAQLAGTMTPLAEGSLTWVYQPGSAGMGLGTYIFPAD